MKLDIPARYFPIEKGIYEVAPGLRSFGTDFGNDQRDSKVFQIDHDFEDFRANKMSCRLERLSKYFQTFEIDPNTETTFQNWMIERLLVEHPSVFHIKEDGNGFWLCCLHTRDNLHFDGDGFFLGSEPNLRPAYVSGLDALSAQVPEDICLMRRNASRSWLCASHLCSPGHWSAEEKIGKDFASIHSPVPGIEIINQRANLFVDSMINKGPYTRFAWGLQTDKRLNHHPEPPPGEDRETWRGRKFDGGPLSKFYLRVERQVMWGLPQANACVFTIRIHYIEDKDLRSHEREALASALLSMTPESRKYKGIHGPLEIVLKHIKQEPHRVALGDS